MTKSTTKTPKRKAADSGPARRAPRRSVRGAPGNDVDARIIELADWRGEALARVRLLIRKVDRAIVEEMKWRKPSNGMAGIPVWSRDGIICTGETYRNVVKLTFPKGASLADPTGLFNAGLEGGTRRAIDIHEDDAIDERAFQALIRAAIAANEVKSAPARKPAAKGGTVRTSKPSPGR